MDTSSTFPVIPHAVVITSVSFGSHRRTFRVVRGLTLTAALGFRRCASAVGETVGVAIVREGAQLDERLRQLARAGYASRLE